MLRVAVCLQLLAGCANWNGVWYPDWRADEMLVYWVRVAPDRINEVCGEAALDQMIRGCSKQKSETSCTIFVPEPIDDVDTLAFETIGEEVAHCFYGNFHE